MSESGEEVEVFDTLGVCLALKPVEIFVSRAIDRAFDAAHGARSVYRRIIYS